MCKSLPTFKLRALSFLGFVVLQGILSGCPPIQHQPFSEFATSIQSLRDGADEALQINYQWSRDRWLKKTMTTIAGGGNAADESVQQLLLDGVPGDPFGWQMPKEPLFMKTRRFREGAHRLNTALLDYANLLKELAQPDVLSENQFTQLTSTLNANVQSAATSLKFEGMTKRDSAMISLAAAELFRQHILNSQRSSLRKAIEENQKSIESLAKLGVEATRIAALHLRQEYEYRSLKTALKLAPPNQPSTQSLESLLQLNERYIELQSILRTLHDTYIALPGAHRELASAVARPSLDLTWIRSVYENGRRLQRLYQDLTEE